jgi:very-short-patch-repair endonuclease
MGLITKTVKIFINTENKIRFYKKRGYNPILGEELEIDIKDAPGGLSQTVDVFCDNCGAEFQITYKRYTQKVKYLPHHDCFCNKCAQERKVREYTEKYGVHNPMCRPEIREKSKQTMIEKYGTDVPMRSEEIRNKFKKTSLERYGTEFPASSKIIRDRIHEVNMERYGVEMPFKDERFRDMALETLQKNHGVLISPFESAEIQRKAWETKIRNCGENTEMLVATSSQQRHICELYNAKLNVFCNGYFIDMVFNGNIACEYDGSGHNVGVKTGKLSQEEFAVKEAKREDILLASGYKFIRIISSNDVLPSDKSLLIIKDLALSCFEKGWSILRYNLNCDEFKLE